MGLCYCTMIRFNGYHFTWIVWNSRFFRECFFPAKKALIHETWKKFHARLHWFPFSPDQVRKVFVPVGVSVDRKPPKGKKRTRKSFQLRDPRGRLIGPTNPTPRFSAIEGAVSQKWRCTLTLVCVISVQLVQFHRLRHLNGASLFL